jgi:hypothetical protein
MSQRRRASQDSGCFILAERTTRWEVSRHQRESLQLRFQVKRANKRIDEVPIKYSENKT